MVISDDKDQELPPIERVAVDAEIIAKLRDDQDYVGMAVSLLIEVGSHVCVAACALPADRKEWNRNEAILGGLLVRLYKMLCALLDQTCQHRRETSFVFARLAYECVINIRYLMATDTDAMYRAYVTYSLRHERNLSNRINTNIDRRNGVVLPIEERMLKSIQRSVNASGITLSEVNDETFGPWKDLSLYDRAAAVGLGDSYLGLIGGPSHTVHGNWQDLVEYHLEISDSGFKPELEWHVPRPQPLLVISKLSLEMLAEYFQRLLGDAAQPIVDDLGDLHDRIILVDKGHESLLSKRQLGT